MRKRTRIKKQRIAKDYLSVGKTFLLETLQRVITQEDRFCLTKYTLPRSIEMLKN